jgi:hypothetical protein
MCAALSPTPPNSSTNSSLSNSGKIQWISSIQNLFIFIDHQTTDEKNSSIDPNIKFQQPAFLRSFEAELDKVDEYFQTKAPDVRQAILDSLQRMYSQNEWHDNPLTMICRDLDIHVRKNTFFLFNY